MFIVSADFLADSAATVPDWTGFDSRNVAWRATRDAVYAKIREFLADLTAERRREAKETVRTNLTDAVARLAPVSRDRWNDFVDAVVDTCTKHQYRRDRTGRQGSRQIGIGGFQVRFDRAASPYEERRLRRTSRAAHELDCQGC